MSKPRDDDEPASAVRPSKSLRDNVFRTFALPYIILFAMLIGLVEYHAHESAVAGVKGRFDLLADRMALGVRRIEGPAVAWIDSAVQNREYGLENGDDQSDLRTHLFFLEIQPQVASVYFGYPNGEFVRVMALRTEESRALTKAPAAARYAQQSIRLQGAKDFSENWQFFDESKARILTQSRTFGNYDPRQRPWYKQTQGTPVGQIAAVGPYEFVTPKLYGITLSARLGGNLNGVGGVDFTLQGLSDFLDEVRGAHALDALMYDAKGRVLAWSRGSEFFRTAPDPQAAVTLADLRDPTLQALTKKIAAPEDSSLKVPAEEMESPGGTAYVAALHGFSTARTQGLQLAVVQRSDVMYAPVRRLLWSIFGIGVLGLLGGVVVIAWLARRIAKPLRVLSRQVKLLQHFKFHEMQAETSDVREIQVLQDAVQTAKVALAGFAKYLPTPLVRHFLAIRAEPKPSVEPREIVAMHVAFHGPLYYNQFTDHRVSQQMQAIAAIIQNTGGLVDAYGNKGLAAIWNAPLIQSNAALRACQAAVDILAQARGAQADLNVHVGIDQGRAGVGNFGNASRLIYSAVGEPVENARDLSRSHVTSSSGIWVGASVLPAAQTEFEFDAAGQLTSPLGRVIEVFELRKKRRPEPLQWPSSDPEDRSLSNADQ